MSGSRPLIVTIVGALYILSAIIVLLTAIAVFVAGTQNMNDLGLSADALADLQKALDDANISWSTLMNILGVILLIPAIINVVIGIGLLRGWKIMWYLGLIFAALAVIFGLIAIIGSVGSGLGAAIGSNIISLIINGVIIWYLLRDNVKAYFKI